MPPPTPQSPRDEATSAEQAEAARFFHEQLKEAGQLVEVDANTDVSALPPKVTHVRYPDGSVKRIRFTASLYQKG